MADPTTDPDNDGDNDSADTDNDESRENTMRPGVGFFPYALPVHEPPKHMKKKHKGKKNG